MDGTQLRANKEVILSGGAIGSPSPATLALGRGDRLRALGLDPILDRPEVENLQDHLDLYCITIDGPILMIASCKPHWAALAGPAIPLNPQGACGLFAVRNGGVLMWGFPSATPPIAVSFGVGHGH